MGILLWIIFGALAGWFASLLVKSGSEGLLGDIVLGVLGAVVGGFIMGFFGQAGVSGFNAYSLFVAVLGSLFLIGISRVLTSVG